MSLAEILDWSVALVPVLVMVVLFAWLDVFKLMAPRELVGPLIMGGFVALVAWPVSGQMLDTLPMGYSFYSRLVAPWIEEAGGGTDIVRITVPLDFSIADVSNVESLDLANGQANRVDLSISALSTDGIDLTGDGIADADLLIASDAENGLDTIAFAALDGWQVEILENGTRRVFVDDGNGVTIHAVVVAGNAEILIA